MENFWIAFVTGLTTGGISCLAVQGGLLASSLATQVEEDLLAQSVQAGSGRHKAKKVKMKIAAPILLFLLAKLVMYTLLGALLGAIGSLFQLSVGLRAALLIAIGVFMIGNALRMFNVHPFFRIFSFEPPKFITRYIRKTSKNSVNLLTPLFLGALTVLIPCGVTQSMMAVALGTGSALQGALILFGFVLGTSPVFFVLSYFATRLGATMEKYFVRIVAVVLVVLGLVSINSGLNLAGSPVSFNRLVQALNRQTPTAQPTVFAIIPTLEPTWGESSIFVTEQPTPQPQVITLAAQNNGYVPAELRAPAGQQLTLRVTTDNTTSCSRAFTIPELGVEEILPKTGAVDIVLPAQASGKQLLFSCSMGMYTGVIIFE
jgi:sulfite exporter TauE/SafE